MDFRKTADPVLNAINKNRYHSSIVITDSKIEPESIFSFTTGQYEDVLRKSKNLNVLTKMLIKNSEYFSLYFHKNINYCLEQSLFPHDLKLADVASVYKKKSKASKGNYRPVSILSNISKVYERCIYDQIQTYFDKILSKYQCGFRKGYNSQQCLIALIEKWKKKC